MTIRIRDLVFRYEPSSPDVIRVPSIDISRGEVVSLLGASGSGKSTLLRLIAGLLTPTLGSVHIAGGAGQAASKFGMVFQQPNLVPWRTAEGNVRLPTELGVNLPATAAQIDELFALVGLSLADKKKRPAELSGGMQMRVSLARSLVTQPDVLLMDEPFSALDDLLRMQLEEDVHKIHAERKLTTVLVTHNIAEAVFMSDRVLVLGQDNTASSDSASIVCVDHDVDLPDERSQSIRCSARFHEHVAVVTDALREFSSMEHAR